MKADAPSPYLAEHIRVALAAASTAELGVDVQLVAGEIHLSGTVSTSEQRDQLAAVATREAGGLPVRNDVVVVHGAPDGEIEVLE